MFTNLPAQPEDKIIGLIAAFKEDARKDKIDLGVGVYRNAQGITPVMRSVKAAEQVLWDTQESKSYTNPAGEPAFRQAVSQILLGDTPPHERLASVAVPGGTGAIRQGFELAQMANPSLRVWVSTPTWPNHMMILSYLGIATTQYRYFDERTSAVDFDAMVSDLSGVQAGDLVVLHGCCHNPTGADLNPVQWDHIIALLNQKGATPFIDIAYQGFGDGLVEDAAALRKVIASVPEAIVAASCSKNFGIYRERTGLLLVLSERASLRQVTQDTLGYLNRLNFSFPPDHGARLVTMILEDDALRADWEKELVEVRSAIVDLRSQLAKALEQETGSNSFGFLSDHRGMFSRLGLNGDQVNRLRAEHGIYMVSDSRINVAGLNATTIPILARAVASVL